jgi:ABC-type sugar transport system permease subunit
LELGISLVFGAWFLVFRCRDFFGVWSLGFGVSTPGFLWSLELGVWNFVEDAMTRRGQILFFVPAFLLFFVFVLLPSTQTFIDSFYSHEDTQRHFVGTLYYRYAITDPRFHQSLDNNLIYLLWTLLFEVTVGLALAVGLEKNSRFNHLLRVAFFSPAVLSMVVVGLVFGFMFKDGVGLLPGLLNPSRALVTISAISGWASAGFFMVIFLAGLANVPEEILEAALLDGASGWQTFWRIKLPLLKEVIYVALLICFTGSTLAVILTLLVLLTVAVVISARNLWLRREKGRPL